MIETIIGARINSKGDEIPELPNDNLILVGPAQSNIIEGQEVMLDISSPSPWCSSAISKTMTMSTSALEIGNERWPSQNLSMTNVNSTQLTPEDTLLLEAQMYQPLVNEQVYEDILAHNSKQTIPSVTHRKGGCFRSVSSTNLSSLCKLDQCGTMDYSSSNKSNITCTLDSCLAMTPELPPVLHLHKNPVADPYPDGLSCVINPYPDPLAISEITKPSPSANISSSGLPISVKKIQKNITHEVAIKSDGGGMAAGEFEWAKSKYDDNGSLNLCISLSDPKPQVSEKLQRKKSEDLHLIGETHSNLDAKIQNQQSARRALPMQHETQCRVPPENCWLNWLRLPNPRFPLTKYRFVNTKVIAVCLSYGLLMSDSQNEGFIIREDRPEGHNMRIYASSWKSCGPEKTRSLECGRQLVEHVTVSSTEMRYYC